MISRATLVLISGLILSLTVAGCRTPSTHVPFETQLLGQRLPDDDARTERVLRQYLEASKLRVALRGSARVSLEGPDFKLNRPQRILVDRPGRLRFEIVGLFDQIAAILAVDGRAFDFYDAATGDVSSGQVTPSLLWDLAKIDLEVPELVELLLATPLPSPGFVRASSWLEPSGRVVLVFAWPSSGSVAACREILDRAFFDPDCFAPDAELEEGAELFYFDAAGQLVEVRNLANTGKLRYRATFEDYQSLLSEGAEVAFPMHTTIHSPGPETTSIASFVWKRVMLTEDLSDRFFEIRRRKRTAAGG